MTGNQMAFGLLMGRIGSADRTNSDGRETANIDLPRLRFKVAVIATDGFEQTELTEPVKALKQAHATVDIVSLEHVRQNLLYSRGSSISDMCRDRPCQTNFSSTSVETGRV